MRRLLVALTSAVSVVALTHMASAADLGRPVYKAAPPLPAPVQDWSGFYVGGEGGYGWGTQNTSSISPGDPFAGTLTSASTTFLLTPPLFFPDVGVPSIRQRGWLGGGFFGAQRQWGTLVLGIEGDIDGADIKGSGSANASFTSASTAGFEPVGGGKGPVIICSGPCFTLNHNVSLDSQIDALASIRGKVGYAFGPNWMIYGTGGAAFANVENTLVSTESSTIAPQIPLTPFQCGQPALCTFSANTGSVRSGSDTTPLFGYAVGGGIDYKWQIDPGSAVVFGVEYLHYGFPERALTLSNDNGNTVSFRAKESVDVVKGRISYLFSIH